MGYNLRMLEIRFESESDGDGGFWDAFDKVSERYGLSYDEDDELIGMMMEQLKKEGLLEGFGLFADENGEEGGEMEEISDLERLSIDDMAKMILAARKQQIL